MNNTLKGILVVVVLGAITYLGMTYPKFTLPVGSAAGSTFNTAKFAGVAMNLATAGANATSSSVYNSDGSSRFVTGLDYGCTGVGSSKTAYTGAGLAALLLTVGTTTTSAPATIPTDVVLANAITVATSSATMVFASSTTAIGTEASMLWPSGTYMTFWFNATNTAVCTIGVEYVGS
jgi:hypothetical protein